ncbi:MAG: hypothetical protein K8R56_00850, partial [Candidatus Eisenbacteria bacterium]|nr:hypothetical protein [Candidatus Eisenbacteria bacterium]
TVLQRIWAGDQSRIERFRRIPFSPVDPRADARLVRESYSRGCQEAGRVLKTLIDEIQREGVPDEVRDTNDVAASEFEDGFPTVDLPLGDVVSTKDPAELVADLMGDMGDLPPQGQDPSSPAPPRLQVEVPPPAPPAPTMAERLAMEAAASAPPAPPVAPVTPIAPVADANAANGGPRKGLNMKARLKDLLGFAQLSAKALAGFPRENDAMFDEPTAPAAPAPSAPVIPAVAVTPTPAPVAPPVAAAPPAPVAPAAPVAPPPAQAPNTGATSQEVSAMLDAWPPKATHERTPEVIGPVGPIEPIAITPPVVAPVALPAPAAPPVAAAPPAAAESPAPAAMGGSDAGYESPSVIMSRPTTLRANIEKVSIDSLISPEFRESDANEPAASEPPAVVEPPVASEPVAPALEPPAPVEPPPVIHTERPTLTLVPPPVRPVIDDPEFMIDPTPSASLPKPTAHVPVPGHAVPPAAKADVPPPPRIVPVPAPAVPAPPAHDSFDDPLEAAMGDVPVSKPDPEAFARAAEDFMKSSPVLGASPRRVTRTPHDEHGFGDPDALAVASIIHDLGDMGVPEARYAETRARLLDLARRLERGELDWATLRKAVWFAMEYPDLARRLMPVLLPWMDRAA